MDCRGRTATFFARCTVPVIDSMTKNYRYFRMTGMILAALLIATVLPAGAALAAGEPYTTLAISDDIDDTSPKVSWDATFAPGKENKFDAIAPTADGGYIVLGSMLTADGENREDLLLVKTDGRGDAIWMAEFPDMAPASVDAAADGGCIAGGYNVTRTIGDGNYIDQGSSFLIRIDAAGKEEWRQVLPGMKISSVRATPDGGYAAVGWLWSRSGSSDDVTAIIIKTDGNGTPAWNRTFSGISANTGAVTADGGYIIGGTTSPFNNTVGDAFLIRLDGDGNTVWHKNYHAPVVYDLEETADGGFVYSGNYWYGLVDADGEEVWLRNMEGFTGHAVTLRPFGGYLVAGETRWTGEGFILGTDADGMIQWNLTLPDSRVFAACNVPGGYTLAGIQSSSPDANDAWLIGLEEEVPATPTPTAAPGFGATAAGAALLLLVAGRIRRR